MQEDTSNVVDFMAARRALRPLPTPCPASLRGARARIYQPAANVRQRGRAGSPWLLELEPDGGSAPFDPLRHVRLSFPSRERAVRFAERRGWPYIVDATPPQRPPRRALPAIMAIDDIALWA